MSVADTIKRNGALITWRKMLGDGGAYDYTTASMSYAYEDSVNIYGVIDGYGDTGGGLESEKASNNTLEIDGNYRVYTTSALKIGDIVGFGGIEYTVMSVKSVWRRAAQVVFMALVAR